VLWYQGESNANNAAQARAYRQSFATLIRSWRGAFPAPGEAMPFLWVQLPNFGAPDSTPSPAPAWALQRESMERALALPNTGQAITIDLGEEGDIHPRNKQDVGARLARVALATAYRRPVLASGPRFRSMRAHGDTVTIAFDDVGSGLLTRAPDGQRVGSFAVAGADRRFVWADARIVGDRVEVWSDTVRAPIAVRYAWSNAPRGPLLYNRDGLPAAPFRTDQW
jgi:sialate O-acetylesterase